MLTLMLETRAFSFVPVELKFHDGVMVNVFSAYKKTLGITLENGKYQKLREETISRYSDHLHRNLGAFIMELKEKDDGFYKRFLNKFGDQTYTVFGIEDKAYLGKKGLYLYKVRDNLMYIGRCKDTYKKRINFGYGKIHPKNCFIDGQSTNCHKNSLISQFKDSVHFYVCPLDNDEEIEAYEAILIQTYNPPWNRTLTQTKRSIS